MAELLEQIAEMTVSDRLKLVQEILKTISVETQPVFDLTEAQKTELDRRWESIENGTAKTTNWESIENKLAERYGFSN